MAWSEPMQVGSRNKAYTYSQGMSGRAQRRAMHLAALGFHGFGDLGARRRTARQSVVIGPKVLGGGRFFVPTTGFATVQPVPVRGKRSRAPSERPMGLSADPLYGDAMAGSFDGLGATYGKRTRMKEKRGVKMSRGERRWLRQTRRIERREQRQQRRLARDARRGRRFFSPSTTPAPVMAPPPQVVLPEGVTTLSMYDLGDVGMEGFFKKLKRRAKRVAGGFKRAAKTVRRFARKPIPTRIAKKISKVARKTASAVVAGATGGRALIYKGTLTEREKKRFRKVGAGIAKGALAVGAVAGVALGGPAVLGAIKAAGAKGLVGLAKIKALGGAAKSALGGLFAQKAGDQQTELEGQVAAGQMTEDQAAAQYEAYIQQLAAERDAAVQQAAAAEIAQQQAAQQAAATAAATREAAEPDPAPTEAPRRIAQAGMGMGNIGIAVAAMLIMGSVLAGKKKE